MLYLYAFVAAFRDRAGRAGHRGAGRCTRAARHGGSAGRRGRRRDRPGGGEHPRARARRRRARLRRTRRCCPFASAAASGDLDDLEAVAARLAHGIEERLEDVRGCVEIGLHVVAPPQPAAPSGSGRDYMQRRLRDLTRAEALAAEIHAPLAEHARDANRTRSVGATALLRAAYLVPRDDVARFSGTRRAGSAAPPRAVVRVHRPLAAVQLRRARARGSSGVSRQHRPAPARGRRPAERRTRPRTGRAARLAAPDRG